MAKVSEAHKTVLVERGKRIKLIRHMLQMRTFEFADFINAGDSTVRYWEAGKGTGLTERGALKIIGALEASNLNCSIEWLLEGKDTPPSFKKEDIVSTKARSPEVAQNAVINIQDEVDLFRETYDNATVLKITDDAMAPYYNLGDYIGGIWVAGHQLNEMIGQICVIQTLDGRTLLRKINAHLEGKNYQLSCINPTTSMPLVIEVEVLTVAPIKRLWR